jgi:hypothetical protein
MKTTHRLFTRLAACGAAGLLAATAAFAQPTNNPNNFNDATSTASFVRWWGVDTLTMTWDATQDAGNDPGSGSVLYTVPYTGAAGDQIMTFFTLANRWGWDGGTVIDGTIYTNFAFDIKVDPSSAIVTGGHYGNLECGLVTYYWDPATTNYAWGTIYMNYGNIPLSATNWTHVDRPVNVAAAHLDTVVGFFFKMWSDGAHSNTLTFNIDNVALQKPEVVVPIPPPTMGLAPSVPGLAFVAASPGQYDRQTIRTVGSNYSWIGRSGPVSYSVDIAQHVPPSAAGMPLVVYLTPGLPDPGRPDSDWHEANVLMWRINQNADGTGWSELNFKTNAPDSNGTMYTAFAEGGGGMGGVGGATGTGLWTLTFNQDTNVTITAPDSATFTGVIPPEVIAIFNTDPHMQVSFGTVPGELSRVGQMITVNGIQITGTSAPNLNSNFVDVPRDTNVWSIAASSAAFGVLEVTTTSPYWLSWSLPAAGFIPQIGNEVAGGTWTLPTLAGFTVGTKYSVLIKQSDLPAGNDAYFRMMKRVGTRLQVLLPGETAAPGTPTGKTGTPTPQISDVPFNIVVNLTDNDWHPVTTPNDLVHLDFTLPEGGYAYPSQDSILLSGTRTFEVTLSGQGTFTITASDVTNPAITSGSASLPVAYP